MPAGLHQLLRATRLRLFDGGRSGPHREIFGDDGARFRAAVCLSHQAFAAAARSPASAVPFFEGWGMFYSRGEAGTVPVVSFLAGDGGCKGCQTGVEEDGRMVSRDREG